MATAALTPEQEAVAHKIDTAGLAMIGAGVLGEVMHRHGAAGGLIQRLGHRIHDVGPYMDLAGLALIAPPLMNPLAKKLAPEQAQAQTQVPVEVPTPRPRDLGEIPVAGQEDPLEQAKTASYVHGVRAARHLFGSHT